MLIASAAMFFAVAGSAFVVRARMAGHCCDRAHPHAVRPVAPLVTGGGAPCGEAVYRANPDGTVSVDFRLCPPEQPAGQSGADEGGLASPIGPVAPVAGR